MKLFSENLLLLIPHKKLFNIPVDDLDYNILHSKINEAINSQNQITIKYINANTIRLIGKNSELKQALLNSDIIHPDGIGIWFSSRILKDSKLKTRFNFTDVSIRFLEDCRKSGWSIFLLGSQKNVLKKAVFKLNENYPGIKIVGTLDGYTDIESNESIAAINKKAPDILWVGMGTPKQEIWIEKNKAKLNCRVIQSVGDLITHLAGEKVRGPLFVQKLGFEWLARTLRHPVKYFNRYIVGVPVFVLIVLKQLLVKNK